MDTVHFALDGRVEPGHDVRELEKAVAAGCENDAAVQEFWAGVRLQANFAGCYSVAIALGMRQG